MVMKLNEHRLNKIIRESIRSIIMESYKPIDIEDDFFSELVGNIDYEDYEEEMNRLCDYCEQYPKLFNINAYTTSERFENDLGDLGVESYSHNEWNGLEEEYDRIYDYLNDFPTDNQNFKNEILNALDRAISHLDANSY